jgi:dTDP-4-dehydrorhamnose reductase
MWLLVGGDSEIGGATFKTLRAQGFSVAATTRRRESLGADRVFLDLAGPIELWEPPPHTSGACIFAGVTRLSACAADPAASAHINVGQTLALVRRLMDRGIPVVFMSTNHVFDGEVANVPADAPVCPITIYGRQKAEVETALLRHLEKGGSVAVLRLAKVVSANFPLLAAWMTALSCGERIQAFGDMMIAPVPAELAVAAITSLLRDRATGIFQLSGPRDVTYLEVAHRIADRLKAPPALVSSICAREAGLPDGATPRNTTLDSGRLRERYGLQAPDAWNVLDAVIAAPTLGHRR